MLSACLCFKDSAAYLEEWLLFHYVQGFRRFYLYDNGSTDDWRTVAEPWIQQGLVRAFEFPGLGIQQQIYDDCLARARGDATWLAFLDDDEFLFPVEDRPLDVILADYDAAAGVAVSWVLFGSDGIETTTAGWVLERFEKSAGSPDPHVKCIVRPERIERSLLIGHSFAPKPGFHVVDENHVPLAEALNRAPSARQLRINHYLVKSWAEWRDRRGRPQANTGLITPHPESTWRAWDAGWSTTADRAAQRFLPAMRAVKEQLLAGA